MITNRWFPLPCFPGCDIASDSNASLSLQNYRAEYGETGNSLTTFHILIHFWLTGIRYTHARVFSSGLYTLPE